MEAKMAEDKKILEENKENKDHNGIPGDIFSKIYENAEKEEKVPQLSEADKKLLEDNLNKPLSKQKLPPLKPESIKEREE